MSEVTTNETAACVNLVKLRGTIVHKYRADTWIVLTLAVAPNPPNRDFPKIYWYDESVEDIDKMYNVGERVETTGRLRTSKQYPVQSIVGRDIRHISRLFEAKFGENGEEFQEDFNEVLLKGEFVRATKPSENSSPEISVVTIKTEINDYTYYPHITCFERHAQRASEIPEGATVYFIAHVRTKKKESEDGTRYFQTVVCRNIRVS